MNRILDKAIFSAVLVAASFAVVALTLCAVGTVFHIPLEGGFSAALLICLAGEVVGGLVLFALIGIDVWTER